VLTCCIRTWLRHRPEWRRQSVSLAEHASARTSSRRKATRAPASAFKQFYTTLGSRNMRSHLYGAIAIAAMIATPAVAQTTTPTSNTMSTPGPGAGTSPPTLSHDGSASMTNSNASSASKSPGAGASPHTGFSSGMTPSAGTASGTADGTTDTGATSPGSGKPAGQR
jgi:hypothetical protein